MGAAEGDVFLKVRKLIAVSIVAGLSLALSWSGRVSAQEITSPYLEGPPTFTTVRHPGADIDVQDALIQAAGGTMIPLWDGSFTSNSTNYPFVMVGTNPTQGSVTTTIPSIIVPLIFRFNDGGHIHGLNPTVNACGEKHTALNLTRNSPIFLSFPYSPGGTSVGTTQYVDAFQRANFWGTVSSEPNYHTLISKTGQTGAVTISVPTADGNSVVGPCARIGQVDILWLDGKLQSLLIKMAALKPKVIPIFLSYNVFAYEGSPSLGAILGYHSEVVNTKGDQTYIYASFSDPNIFNVPIEDIDALSHEDAEWTDDPLVLTNINVTPAWGNVGQVSGCQTDLEVGDPLTGNAITVTNPTNHFTYHPQDLTFVPWFAQGTSSTSVNGWFDFNHVFTSSAVPCT